MTLGNLGADKGGEQDYNTKALHGPNGVAAYYKKTYNADGINPNGRNTISGALTAALTPFRPRHAASVADGRCSAW